MIAGLEDLSPSENKIATNQNESNDTNLTVIGESDKRTEFKVGTLR